MAKAKAARRSRPAAGGRKRTPARRAGRVTAAKKTARKPPSVTAWRCAKSSTGRTQPQRALIYLLCTAVFITLFFSCSTSKLPTYILPVLPLLALSLGRSIAARAVLASLSSR